MTFMQQALIAYPGILYPKGGVYTQTLGTRPDAVSIRCVPQATAIPSSGTVTMSWGGSSLTLPNCQLDSARIVTDAEDGFLLSIVLRDRRERWKFAPPISGVYNIWRAGTQVVSKKLSLRALAALLFTQMGEGSAVVTALSSSIYPEVRWNCEPPAVALERLLYEWGFSVALGFGSEAPTVVQLGVGTTLSTAWSMMVSSSVDPKTKPQYVRTCFNDSLAQVRFLMEAVALETDNTWVPINSVSYKPAGGWEAEDPHRLPTVEVSGSADDYNRAIATVFRAFRIYNFAAGETGTLNLPDGSGTLASIAQTLPLYNRLLDDESIRSDGSEIPFRIYGKRRNPGEVSGQPPVSTNTSIDDEIVGAKVEFDGENGIIIFEEPQYWVNGSSEFKPAVLFLECTCKLTSATTFAKAHYEKDTLLDAAGYGYHPARYPDAELRTVAAYGASQAVSGTTNNQAALDAIAALVAASVSSQYTTDTMQMVVYNQPILSLRCDGAITQIQHVISDGTSHAGAYTVASRNSEFDKFIRTRDERTALINSLVVANDSRAEQAIARRRGEADD